MKGKVLIMNTQEMQLLDLFRACSPDRRAAIIYTAQIILDIERSESIPFTDPAPVPAADPAADAPDQADVQTSIRQSRLLRTAEKASHAIPMQYQLTTSDFYVLYDMVKSDQFHDPFYAICRTFEYGFVMGNRATRRGRVKNL